MAQRNIYKKTKYIIFCENAKKQLIKICKKHFCYQEIKIYVTEKIFKENELFFCALRKEKYNIYDVEIIKEKERNYLIDEKVALVVAVAGEEVCREIQSWCNKQEKNYCVIPVGFLNESLFLSDNKPFAVFVDSKLSDLSDKFIVSNIFATIVNKKFNICEIKLESVLLNKSLSFNYIKQLNEFIKMALSYRNDILNNNKEKIMMLIKVFINMCLFLQNFECEYEISYEATMENLIKNEVYIQFFENISKWCINPVKKCFENEMCFTNFKKNYDNFDGKKYQYIASLNARYCLELLYKSKKCIIKLINFLKLYNYEIYYNKKFIQNITLENLTKKLDYNSNDCILKIIRNMGFLNC